MIFRFWGITHPVRTFHIPWCKYLYIHRNGFLIHGRINKIWRLFPQLSNWFQTLTLSSMNSVYFTADMQFHSCEFIMAHYNSGTLFTLNPPANQYNLTSLTEVILSHNLWKSNFPIKFNCNFVPYQLSLLLKLCTNST